MANPSDTPEIIDLEPDAVTDHDSKPEPEPMAKPAPAPASRAVRPVLAVAALAIAAIAGGWVYRDLLTDYFPSNQMQALQGKALAIETSQAQINEKLAGLERLAGQLKADIDASESAVAGAASAAKSATETVTGLGARIDRVEGDVKASGEQLAALSSQLSQIPAGSSGSAAPAALPADLLDRLATLEKDVASLKAAKSNDMPDTAALSQVMADVKAKIESGLPYAEDLARLQRLVPAAAGLDVLAQFSAAGAPTKASLAQELQSLSGSLPGAEQMEPVQGDDSWTGWLLEKASGLITIRVAGETDWKRQTEAAAALADSGDLVQAIDLLSKAEGTRPAGVQQWLDKATARLSLDAAAVQTEDAVKRVIAAKG